MKTQFTEQWLHPSLEELKTTSEFIELLFSKEPKYYEMVDMLNRKYGNVPYPFIELGRKSKCCKKGQRREMLEIHHIREDTLPNICEESFVCGIYKEYLQDQWASRPTAVKTFFEWLVQAQEPTQLVYANKFEHLALHMTLARMEPIDINAEIGAQVFDAKFAIGIGGVAYLYIACMIPLTLRKTYGEHAYDILDKREVNICRLYDTAPSTYEYILETAKQLLITHIELRHDDSTVVGIAERLGLASIYEEKVNATEEILKGLGTEYHTNTYWLK